MKKAIIILSLIYFISCSSLCDDNENLPTKKEDCYERETSFVEKECCYAYIDITLMGMKSESKSCFEFEIGADFEEEKKKVIEEIESLGGKIDAYDLYCSSHEKEDTSEEDTSEKDTSEKDTSEKDTSEKDTTKPNSSSSYLRIGFLLILCLLL